MPYTKTTWATGDIVTSAKLNNLEEGVRGVNGEYVPTVWATGDVVTADKLNKLEQGVADASGGSSLLHCSVTFINNTRTEQTIIGIIYATENNALSTYPSTMLPVGTSVFDVYYSEDSEGMWAEVTVENCVITASNEINCTLDSGDSSFIYLTNYENPSSITLTVTEEQAGGATTK